MDAQKIFAARCAAAGGLPLVLCAAIATVNLSTATAQAAGGAAPDSIDLTGTVRDFRERAVAGGHPDFEHRPDLGFRHYMGNVAAELGDDGRPVFTGAGYAVGTQWRDADARPICYTLFDPSLGDAEGAAGPASRGGITSADSFGQWFRDVPGTNLSKALTLRFVRQPDGGYIFDDKADPVYGSRGGFFPIDDELFGNSRGTPDHNFHFTFELHALFTYDASEQQVFKFIGDDDVYVFIDGKLVIDIGGVHPAVEQYVDLDRLGLTDGETYKLDFFYAERHRSQANFRIVTNLELMSAGIPTISASYD